jgi:hypothetical protein
MDGTVSRVVVVVGDPVLALGPAWRRSTTTITLNSAPATISTGQSLWSRGSETGCRMSSVGKPWPQRGHLVATLNALWPQFGHSM